jgi:hypothetical protein
MHSVGSEAFAKAEGLFSFNIYPGCLQFVTACARAEIDAGAVLFCAV